MKVVLAGATGLIGKELTNKLVFEGHEVRILSRHPKTGGHAIRYFQWEPSKGEIDADALADADVIINLAGANVADKRWSKAYKKVIIDSRVLSTRLLVQKLPNYPSIRLFINASGISYYGMDTGRTLVDENSPVGHDFLAQVVEKWDYEAFESEKFGVRTIALRQGVVLSAEGGALPKLIAPIKWGVGSALGSGKQYFPWIDMDDLIEIYLFCIRNHAVSGAYNIVAPELVTNEEFTKQLASHLGKKIFLPNVPGFILKLLLGEFAGTLLGGNKASCEKLRRSGFEFSFPTLKDSFNNHIKSK